MNALFNNQYASKTDLRNSIFEGYVVNTDDPLKKGRVKVSIPGLTRPSGTTASGEVRESQVTKPQLPFIGSFLHYMGIGPNSDMVALSEECLPWYMSVNPIGSSGNESKGLQNGNTAGGGSRVLVRFYDNDIYSGVVIGTISQCYT